MTSRAFAASVCLVVGLPALAVVHPVGREADTRLIQPVRVSPQDERITPGAPTPSGQAARSFVERHGGDWEFTVDRRTGRARLVQGSGIPLVPGRGNSLAAAAGPLMPDGLLNLDVLEPLARSFIDDAGAMLLPSVGRLVLDRETSVVREEGRLASLYFNWVVDGLPVEGASVFLRLNSGNITQFGAPLVGPIDLDTTPLVQADTAVRVLMQHSNDEELYRLQGEPRLIVQPEDADASRLAHRLVWKITYRNPGRLETWEGRVDAHTGEVVGFRDTNSYARAVGGIFPRTVFDDNEISVPIPRLNVINNFVMMPTDTAGFFEYEGGFVNSEMNGPNISTNCQGCSFPAQPEVQTTVGTGRLDFGLGGLDQVGNGLSTPADRNSYYHLKRVRRIAEKWLPDLDWLDGNLVANVNINSSCNAVYSGLSVNFFRSGAGCNNTGEIADVIYHEWGHGLDVNTRSGDGATGEGTADAIALQLTHDARVGPGFRTSGAPVRNLNRAITPSGLLSVANVGQLCPVIGDLGPLGYEVHCEGEILGQTMWDLSQLLTARHGHHTGWRTSERLLFTSLPDAGGYLPDSSFPIYDSYLNADDDDGNLANGTPNAGEIYGAFELHGLANDQLPSSTPCVRPQQPVVGVAAQCDRFELSWGDTPGVEHYEIFRGELLADSAFFPVAEVPAGQTGYVDSEVAPGIDYWYVVMAVDVSGCESTIEDPVLARLTAQPVLSVAVALDDDTPRGNRSGFVDPGEEVDLVLTVANFGEIAASGVSGTLVSTTDGVTILDAAASWPDIPTGQARVNEDVLRFITDEGQIACGDTLSFRFVPDESSGCAAEMSYFDVRVGQEVAESQQTLQAAGGWSVDAALSTALEGDWVHGIPRATGHQPGARRGSSAWFTGPNPDHEDGDGDVDHGVTVLVSPTIDLSDLDAAELSYHRWYANSEPGLDPGDYFAADVSPDGGLTWVNLEQLDFEQNAPSWTAVDLALEQFIELTDEVRIRFRVADGEALGSVVEAGIDSFGVNSFQCDDTPACFVEPSFDGLAAAAAGSSCAETTLSWTDASSNCLNATLSYNVYRSTDPAFVPGPDNLVAPRLPATSFADSLLEPGQTYHYAVRAYDSRSGEDSNLVRRTVVAPPSPDLAAPVFGGLVAASPGSGCGEVQLSWNPALETCNAPVSYEVYRSTDPAFTPAPGNRIGSALSTSFVDAALEPGAAYHYVVRARDAAGNEDPNSLRIAVDATVLDLLLLETRFEAGPAGWNAVPPNDAVFGNWEWGEPEDTGFQPGDDATPDGVNCWMTGLSEFVSGNQNNDVDEGTTTLLSASYDLLGAVDPMVSYARWFTNDRGASPGQDPFVIEVSNDAGDTWSLLEQVGSGTPLDWVRVDIPLAGITEPASKMRFRFSASDLGEGSLVEAGIDDFALWDREQGCLVCSETVGSVGTILVGRSGSDAVLDWTADPAPGSRFAVYKLGGPSFEQAVRVGTADGRTFVHEGAILAGESFFYRVTAIDACGNESNLE